MLVAAPKSTAGTRLFGDPREDDRNELTLYQRRLTEMLGVPYPVRNGTRNELIPRKLFLDAEAQRVWKRFHDFVEPQLAKDGELAPVSGLANKAPEHAARLAAVLTLWRDMTASFVTGHAMAQATELVQFYLGEALRLRGAAAVGWKLKLAQRVLDWLLERWPEPAVYPAAIYNDCTISVVRDHRIAREILHILEHHGWLNRIEGGAQINGRQRKEAWLIYGRTM